MKKTRTDIEIEYFEWMYEIVCSGRYAKENSYRKLLEHLHELEFHYIISKDSNRAEDGEDLSYRVAYETYSSRDRDIIVDYLSRPCSVLEMMIALSIRCEDIMDDPSIGDRTGQWFWKMIVNLGLGSMYDSRFNEEEVDEIIDIFLKREYEADGRGGLFRIRGCKYDLRKFEIWIQALWFLDTMIKG